MMTPMHTDMIKHSTPAAPTAQEREAARAHRRAGAATFVAFIRQMFAYAPRPTVAPPRPRFNAPS